MSPEKIICDYCGEEIAEGEETFEMVNGDVICEWCRENGTITCERCGGLEYSEEAIYVDVGDFYVCRECFDSGDFDYCANCDSVVPAEEMCYVEAEDSYYCSACYEDYIYENGTPNLLDYHSGEGRDDCSEDYRYRVGVEIEKEDKSVRGKYTWENVLDETGWAIEEDGSLDDWSGFEAISPIYPLKVGTLGKKLKDPTIRDFVEARQSSSCGGHITISDTKRTPKEIINDIGGYLPILYALFPHRVGNGYCRPKKKSEYEVWDRSALHIRNEDKGSGLEIRLFDSPKNTEDLLNRFRILKYMLQHKAETTDKALREIANNKRFRKYITKQIEMSENTNIDRFYDDVVKFAKEIEGERVRVKIGKLSKLKREN